MTSREGYDWCCINNNKNKKTPKEIPLTLFI